MRERRKREWLMLFARSLTRQTARKAPPHKGCGKMGRSWRCAPWHRSPGYDLRRAPYDHPDFTSNALSEDLFSASLISHVRLTLFVKGGIHFFLYHKTLFRSSSLKDLLLPWGNISITVATRCQPARSNARSDGLFDRQMRAYT